MDLIRDLVRDLVGIIFPGGLLIIFTLWVFFGTMIVLIPLDSFNVFSIVDNSAGFFALLIFSYVAGQSLRIRRLNHLERKCAQEYRKKYKPEVSEQEFDQAIKNVDKEEENYHAGNSTSDRLRAVYEQYNKRFGFWEEFPYPYVLKGRRLLGHSTNYNEFFEKYDKQGITKYSRFFNFLKSVIYEYSPSLKEEVLRQEALVRLFAGIFYVIKYGKIISVIMGVLHLALIVSFFQFRIDFLSYANLEYSYGIVIISVFAYFAFRYLNKEILNQLRFMRAKELNLAYDGFYLICKRHELDIE